MCNARITFALEVISDTFLAPILPGSLPPIPAAALTLLARRLGSLRLTTSANSKGANVELKDFEKRIKRFRGIWRQR